MTHVVRSLGCRDDKTGSVNLSKGSSRHKRARTLWKPSIGRCLQTKWNNCEGPNLVDFTLEL